MRQQHSTQSVHDQHERQLALETAAEHCSDTCVALWTVTTHRGIPRELRADLQTAIELLRKIRAGVRDAAERGSK